MPHVLDSGCMRWIKTSFNLLCPPNHDNLELRTVNVTQKHFHIIPRVGMTNSSGYIATGHQGGLKLMCQFWDVNGRTELYCQGMSKTGSILDVRVPVELWWIYKGPLKGNVSLLSRNVIMYGLKYVHGGDFTWVGMRRKLPSHSTWVQLLNGTPWHENRIWAGLMLVWG